MGFRRDGKRKHHWDAWVATNREALLQSGIPEAVYLDKRRFTLAVQQETDWDSGWHSGLLTCEQAEVVHRLLVEQRVNLSDMDVDGMIRSLEAQFGFKRSVLPKVWS